MKKLEDKNNEQDMKKFKDENFIKKDEDGMEGIKITDENVDEIVDSLLSNIPPFSEEYIKMFSDL